MKKLLLFVALCFAALSACRNNQNVNKEQSANADTLMTDSLTETVTEDTSATFSFTAADKEMTAKIVHFYAQYILADNELSEKQAHEFCSDRMIKQLKQDYSDEYDGNGLAVWDFRTGADDGEGQSKLMGIKKIKDHVFEVSFSDMGNEATATLTCVDTNEGGKIDQVEVNFEEGDEE